MIARDKFKIGQEVKPTRKCRDALKFDEKIRGYVVGFRRSFPCDVLIEHDGADTAGEFHMDLWELVDDG